MGKDKTPRGVRGLETVPPAGSEASKGEHAIAWSQAVGEGTPETAPHVDVIGGELEPASTGRPAETTAGAGGLAAALAIIFGTSAPTWVPVVVFVVGVLPAVVTYLHDHGGIAGIVDSLLHGR